jgi:hypothetical protein
VPGPDTEATVRRVLHRQGWLRSSVDKAAPAIVAALQPSRAVILPPAVARALSALALPGEAPAETIARLVWACGRPKEREPISRGEESGR